MRQLILIFLMFVGLASCGTYEKVVQSKDIEYKLAKANEYYEKGKFFEASRVYESLIPVLRGSNNYEELYYRFAYSFYYDKDYLNASYQFKNFTDYFSKSDRVEEMQYMQGVATYKDARKVSLDQTETGKAIASLQTFMNMYPNSKFAPDAELYLDSAVAKLEEKSANAALQYYNLDDYRSASVAYKTMIFDYPDSKIMDYYYFMVVKSLSNYASLSRPTSQRERYLDANSYYESLKSYYPNSKYMAEANKLNNLAQEKIKTLK